jgi:hypothetical protein
MILLKIEFVNGFKGGMEFAVKDEKDAMVSPTMLIIRAEDTIWRFPIQNILYLKSKDDDTVTVDGKGVVK